MAFVRILPPAAAASPRGVRDCGVGVHGGHAPPLRRKAVGRPVLAAATALIVLAASTLSLHAVDNSLSAEDRRYIPLYLDGIAPLPENASYEEELRFITAAQRSVLGVAKGDVGLPPGQQREPRELYEAGTGSCYDRSRVLEKILRYSGFRTRHIAMYSTAETMSAIRSLATPGTASHAVTEVLTRNGWLVVDSNAPWVSTDEHGQPMSMTNIQAAVARSVAVKWRAEPPSAIYRQPFVFVYGLYSRHGNFFPPYGFIPDIHYGEFAENVGTGGALP